MELKLEGKVAIVTGGARGIGGAVVEGLVKEGASVVIADTNLDDAQKLAQKLGGQGGKVLAIKTDVTRKSDVEKMAATTLKTFGKIDILVNDAAVGPALVNLTELEEKDWDRVNTVNVKGTYMATRAVVPHMIAARYGKIVNFSSVAGKMGEGSVTAYCASKFAIIGFTQALAMELAEHSINVNAVCPGTVRTAMWEQNLDIISRRTGEPREEIFRKRCESIPMKRPQSLEDIANVVIFLSSDIASNITGESISVNGGQRMD
jgi:meso-butanediol dehydrogenase/(S,S)-butanediol dehydrogenase/diacetyl reductase